jgi:DNA gyrase/topoisomerase IV subunit A
MTNVKGLGLLSVLVAACLILNLGAVVMVMNQEPVEVERVIIVNQSVPMIVEKEVVVNDPRIDELFKREFSAEFNEIENEAELAVIAELEAKDYKVIEDLLKATVDGFDELRRVTIEEVEVTVVKLGLGKDEDKVANVEVEVSVRYTLKEGQVAVYKKNLVLNAMVTFEEGDFSDAEVVFA